jgi:hypothetical protein
MEEGEGEGPKGYYIYVDFIKRLNEELDDEERGSSLCTAAVFLLREIKKWNEGAAWKVIQVVMGEEQLDES